MLSAPSAAERLIFCFVIPVRNDASRLRRCLETLADNEYPKTSIDVVVVDNGSSDGSPDVAQAAGARLLTLPGLRVAELRNRGASTCSGDILAFVDADHEIGAHWLSAAALSFQDDSVGAVGALCHPPARGTWVQRTYDLLRDHPPGIQEVPWLGSGNLAVRRSAFERIGGFDESLETCEDVELCQRLRRMGYRILSNEGLYNVHLGDPTGLRELYLGELWRGRDNLRVSLRMISSVRELASVLIPILDLVLLAFAAIMVLVTGSAWWAGSAIGVLALAALRSARMITRMPHRSFLGILQAFAVATVYDLARALALVARKQHRRVSAQRSR